MINRAFSVIIQKIEQVLGAQNFSKFSSIQDNKKLYQKFVGQGKAYVIKYNFESKQFELLCGTKDEPDTDLSVISSWLFDPATDDERQAQSIAADFSDVLSKPIKSQNKNIQKRKKDDDGNVDPLFFMNRLASLFPELKDKIKYEREHYAQFRFITFAQQNAVPKIIELINSTNDTAKIKKLASLLSSLYSSGDLDVRSIITIVILNSIEEEGNGQKLNSELSEELKKAWKCSKKLKGKPIKPEKVKKPHSYMSATLNSR